MSVRAYMSVPGDGPVFYDNDGVLCYGDGRTFDASQYLVAGAQDIAARAAVREAERILRETERPLDGFTAHARLGGFAGLKPGARIIIGREGRAAKCVDNGALALAEALASFIGGEGEEA